MLSFDECVIKYLNQLRTKFNTGMFLIQRKKQLIIGKSVFLRKKFFFKRAKIEKNFCFIFKIKLNSKTLFKKKFFVQKFLYNLNNLNLNLVRLKFVYIRYANDWIILTNGKKYMMDDFGKNFISFFYFKFKIKLSLHSSFFTDTQIRSVSFFGFELKVCEKKNLKMLKVIHKKEIVEFKFILIKIKWFITPSNQKLINRIYSNFYCDKFGFPREIQFLVYLKDFLIIGVYNVILQAILKYYLQFIKNPKKSISRWLYIIKYSFLKTLAQKHKMTIKKLCNLYKLFEKKEYKLAEKLLMNKVKFYFEFKKYRLLLVTEELIKKLEIIRYILQF